MSCSYCLKYPAESYFKSYCEDCANLRRILILYDSKKCIDILNRVLLRTDPQISNKVNLELKKNMIHEIKKNNGDDKKDYDKL